MSPTKLLLVPVFIQVALTLALVVWTGRARVAAIRRGEVMLKDIALGQQAWPARVTQISNTYSSQFEAPVLFYVAVVLAVVLQKTDWVVVAAAWLFVASRLAHAYVYTGNNYIPARFRAFVVGVFTLMALWAWLAVRILVEAG